MDIKDQIKEGLGKAVKDLVKEDIEIQVEAPSDASKGDFTTNIAMIAFGRIKNHESRIMNPMELAEKIIELLNSELIIHNSFRLVEAKNPGFINFWLSNSEIEKSLTKAIKGFDSKSASNSSLILEFGDLNPFKEPHIGHVRNLALGEALARLFKFNGIKVVRANYEGDVGMHVAKALYGLLKIPNPKSQISNLENEDLDQRIRVLAKAYAAGAKAFEEDEDAKKEMISINNKIYQKDPQVIEIWEKGRQWSLDYFEELYKKLGISYDKYYFESETAPEGLKIVKENIGKVFEEDAGAIVFRGEDYGFHTRVFVTKEGYATYEGKDLALAVLKNKDFPQIEKSMIMTANEQLEYFKVLLKALELTDKKIADKTSHLSFGFVNLKEGKMSSRTGNVVGANWLLEETKKRLRDEFKEVPEGVLDDLSVGAVKWSMLKFSRESNISFSIEESIDLAGNSGPYMQYTCARIASLVNKGSKANFEANSVKSLEPELLALGRTICQFESFTKMASDNFSPNILTEYLFGLAQNFNAFYEKEKIIGSDSENEKIMVTYAVGNVLKKGLDLLGINAPEKI